MLPPNGYLSEGNQSQKAMLWMRYLNKTEGIHIQHAKNGEKIGKYKSDGYCASTKPILEFHGCFWHACEKCFPNRNTVHPMYKVTMNELYMRTLEKKRSLRAHAPQCKYVEMWECDWDRIWKKYVQGGAGFVVRRSARDWSCKTEPKRRILRWAHQCNVFILRNTRGRKN